jgi:hypothetical protein
MSEHVNGTHRDQTVLFPDTSARSDMITNKIIRLNM